jgi:Protein of unknown function (DUF3188)
MLNEFWETSGRLYKVLVFTAMGLIAVGLVLTVAGANTENRPMMLAGLPFLGAGMVTHVVGLMVRGREVRRRLHDR